MLFGRKKQRDREAASRLAGWAIGQAGHRDELERLFGSDHAEELGPLAWLFRAVEAQPIELPTLGRWQQWESQLRRVIGALPPPRPSLAAMAAPFLLFPNIDAHAMRTAVGDMIWKSAMVAAATTALTFQIVTSEALKDFSLNHRVPRLPTITVQGDEPTGNAVVDHVRRNWVATQPGGLDQAALARFQAPHHEVSG